MSYDAQLGWAPVAGVAGYKVYMRQGSSTYGAGSDVGSPAVGGDGQVHSVVPNLSAGVMNYFAVSAYDAAGAESALSNELSLMVAPTPTATASGAGTGTTAAPTATSTSTAIATKTATLPPTAPATATGTPAATAVATATPSSTATRAPTTTGATIWAAAAAPANAAQPDTSAVELGVKFTSEVNGLITGIRFYKSATNTGAHTGTLWSSAGAKLATAVFTNETASGWQQVDFATPVAITANTVYVASYHTDAGYYAGDIDYFATAGVDSPPLHALPDGANGGNGLYVYGASAFPNNTFRSINYWVDVVFNAASSTTPTRTPTSTATPPQTSTRTASVTSTTTHTATATNTIQPTSTTTATRTASPSSTATATYTVTPLPTNTTTATSTRTPASTATATSSATASATRTATATNTAPPTGTTTATRTASPSSTATATYTVTPLPTDTATWSPTETSTATSSATRTATFTASASATAIDTATRTSSAIPTDTATPPSSATATATNTATTIASATHTATFSASATATPVDIATPTSSASPTDTALPVSTASASATATTSATDSATSTATATSTAMDTASPTNSPTATLTLAPTATFTATVPTATNTATGSPTSTLTPSFTPTPTATPVSAWSVSIDSKITVMAGTTVSVPVNITAGSGVRVFELHLAFDPGVIAAQGVELPGGDASGTLSADYATPGELIVSATLDQPMTAGGALVNVSFTAVGACVSSTPVDITSCVLDGGAIGCQPSDGRVTVRCGVGGRIRHRSSGAPVGDATVALMSTEATATATTDDLGQFVFGETTDGTWQLEPRKTGDVQRAVSALDAALVLQAAAGRDQLDPVQQAVCDVTGNGHVTSLDAVRILQFAVGQIAHLPVAQPCDSDWAFIPDPASASNRRVIQPQFSATSCRQGGIVLDPLVGDAPQEDFTAVPFGDCTGNWGAAQNRASLRSSSDDMRVRLGTARLRAGGQWMIPLYVARSAPFRGLDARIAYDPAATLTAVRPVGAAAAAMVRYQPDGHGGAALALASGDPMNADGGPVAVLVFDAVQRSTRSALTRLLSAAVDEVDVAIGH